MKYILKHPVKGTIGSEKYLLLSALISCTLATLRMYIDHKLLDIPEISVEANMFQKIGTEGTVMHIARHIAIPGNLEPEQQQRLIRVAENCPVSKILKGSIKIISEFGTAGSVMTDTEINPTKTDHNIDD